LSQPVKSLNHPVQCRCGTLRGYVSQPQRVNHCVCYCRDCQAFAHFLGGADEIIDAAGGTEIIQTTPAHVTLTAGAEALGCMRLSPNGLLRWYTTCCNTPIGNTLPNFRVSFVGLIHNCLQGGGESLDDFGPIRMRVNTQGAKQAVKSNSLGVMSGMLHILGNVARARIDGSYRRTPFFRVGSGVPVVTPKVLSREERTQVMAAVSR
jgi:Family of unknown function (DUF6151)